MILSGNNMNSISLELHGTLESSSISNFNIMVESLYLELRTFKIQEDDKNLRVLALFESANKNISCDINDHLEFIENYTKINITKIVEIKNKFDLLISLRICWTFEEMIGLTIGRNFSPIYDKINITILEK
nr:hypothetical protein [Sphingomonas sp. Y57]